MLILFRIKVSDLAQTLLDNTDSKQLNQDKILEKEYWKN